MVDVLALVREINLDVIHRMQLPPQYGQQLAPDASKILGKETAQILKKKNTEECQHFVASLEVADALQAHKMMSQLHDAAVVWTRKHLESEENSADARTLGRLGLLMGATPTPNVAAQRGAANAQRIALALRKAWPKAPQTALEVSKIKSNLDVGLAAMEALSRVLEGRAATILAHLKNIVKVGHVPLPLPLSQHPDLV